MRDKNKEDSFSPLNRVASHFVVPTRRTITRLQKQKEEGTWAAQAETIDLTLEPVKHIFVKNPDIYNIKFE